MRLVQRFKTDHDDLIHDVAYDYYGRRLATCASDQKISVWDLDEHKEWKSSAEWKAHHGSVWKVHWAAPEFGQLLASCSFDRTVCIWEEPEDAHPSELKKWERRATLGDSHGSVSTVRFAPAHQGLKLATGSADGIVRIYEAIDITNLSQWQINHQIECGDSNSGGVNCLDWNPNPFDPAMIAVGTSDNTAKIYQHNDKLRKWELACSLPATPGDAEGHTGPILDIAWAPNMGRSYHLVATASRDKTVRVWRIDIGKGGKYEAKLVKSFPDHNAEVWRVEWNITGTILASSGDDNAVRLWKQTLLDQWLCLSVITGAEEGVGGVGSAASAATF